MRRLYLNSLSFLLIFVDRIHIVRYSKNSWYKNWYKKRIILASNREYAKYLVYSILHTPICSLPCPTHTYM
jgi:hypothetical protein